MASGEDASRDQQAGGDGTQDRARSAATVRTLAIAAAAALAATGLLAALGQVAPDLGDAQRATGQSFDRFVSTSGLQAGVLLDCLFAIAYVAFGVLVFSLFRSTDVRKEGAWDPGAVAGAGLLIGAGLADLMENAVLYSALRDWLPGSLAAWLAAMRAAGVAKWALLAAAVFALLILILTRKRCPFEPGDPHARPGDTDGGVHPWDPPEPGEDGKPSRLGICLSGGGVRSAAFSLGGLQALQDKGILSQADYLAAASGGGYLAAGWAVADAVSPAVSSGQAWSRGSPEERWFRDHSSYLIPDLLGGLKGVGRLLGGVVVNFLIVWLLLFLVARPAGWAIAATHPELGPVEPVALARDTTGAMRIDRVEPSGAGEAVVGGAVVRAERYAVSLAPVPAVVGEPPRANEVCFDTQPFDPGDRQHCFTVEQEPTRPAIVEVRAGKAEVLVQPRVRLDARCASIAPGTSETCDVRAHLEVTRHPTVGLTREAVQGRLDADQLEVSRQAQVRSRSGLVGRPDPEYRSWMWQGSGTLAVAGLVALWVMGRRPRDGGQRPGRTVALALGLAGAACLLLTIVLPALAAWLPNLAPRLPGTDIQLGDSLLPSGGLLAVSIAAARQYLSGNKKGSGTGPAEAPPSSPSLLTKLRKGLTGRKEQLTWYETSPTKILLAVLLAVGFAVSFIAQLQYATANGWQGRLMGLSFVRDNVPNWAFQPEWVKYLFVVVAMAGFASSIDAHSWSLYPFYKRQLSSAYILRRSKGRATPIPYDELLPFTDAGGRWAGLPGGGGPHDPGRSGPRLVLCCAVNLSEYGTVPPGRRAASFTFGSDFIGGPVVGYVKAADYWRWLPESRRRDITIPSAMAISGAAFSPAMGKTNLGAVGSVLALANLRLGVWLPHPQRVTEANAGRWNGRSRPGWTWFAREVLNNYRFQRPYLYVSDGGHWDNLGLVELLRRGCTSIICISAAGDGALGFGTIAEAIALAREELGVEIELDPTPLRPPVKPPAVPPPRELRRRGSTDKAAPFAPASSVVGTYTWRTATAEGTILYIETALTPDMAFDVHGFAESETIFPDDSTADQVFNHRQFEAFRALGYRQVSSALP